MLDLDEHFEVLEKGTTHIAAKEIAAILNTIAIKEK